MNLRGGGATYNQAPSSVLAESNGITRHPEPKAKDPIKKQVDSSVASLLQNDVQGASGFLGLCLQNDKAAQGDSSGIRPQNDMTHCDEPIRSDLSDENTQNPKCRDSEVNNNCRQGKRQRRVLSERSEFTRQNAESCKLLENGACGWFASLCHQSDRCPRRTKQKPEVDSSVASLLQNDKAAQGDSSGIRPQNDIKKEVILSQRRRIYLKHNRILHSVQNARKKSKHAAFTMAEVLITLGIIGVVAAMTLPALINNAQNKELEEGLKRSYSVLSQALDMYYAQNGERLTHENIEGGYALKAILKKYLNVVQDCGLGNSDSNKACIPNTSHSGFQDNGQKINKYRTYNNKADIWMNRFDDGQLVLNDGSLILIDNSTYDPNLLISVDINGFHKNPNKLGQDLFMFQIDEKGTLLPMGVEGTQYYSKTKEYCSPTSTSNMNGAGCTYRALTDKTFFRRKGR